MRSANPARNANPLSKQSRANPTEQLGGTLVERVDLNVGEELMQQSIAPKRILAAMDPSVQLADRHGRNR